MTEPLDLGASFVSPETLARLPYGCSTCPARFNSPGHVAGHYRKAHPGQRGQSKASLSRQRRRARQAEPAEAKAVEVTIEPPPPAPEAAPPRPRRRRASPPALDSEAGMSLLAPQLPDMIAQLVASRQAMQDEVKRAVHRAETAEALVEKWRKIITDLRGSLDKVDDEL